MYFIYLLLNPNYLLTSQIIILTLKFIVFLNLYNYDISTFSMKLLSISLLCSLKSKSFNMIEKFYLFSQVRIFLTYQRDI